MMMEIDERKIIEVDDFMCKVNWKSEKLQQMTFVCENVRERQKKKHGKKFKLWVY